MKGFIVIALSLASFGCASFNESMAEADAEVAKWIDTYCLNTTEAIRTERRDSINSMTKIGDILVDCE